MNRQQGSWIHYGLTLFFGLFILFLYSPMLGIVILSLQGPEGSLTFPMKGFSFYWLQSVFEEQRIGNFVQSFWRSFLLGLIVTLLTVVISTMGSLAFRRRFPGSTIIFYLTISSLIVPSILISLGIGVVFNLLGWESAWYTSALGAHLTWTLPFAFLLMIGVFNRFDPAYEEVARDLGAGDIVTFWQIVFPLIAPSLIGVALLGFTLSYDEFTRTSLISGATNTLPLEVFGMTTNITSPALYALGTLTTVFSFMLITLALAGMKFLERRQK